MSSLRNTTWESTQIIDTHFSLSTFDGADFKSGEFSPVFILGCEFVGMPDGTVGTSSMHRAPLKGAKMSGAQFMGCTFANANIPLSDIRAHRFGECGFFFQRDRIPLEITQEFGDLETMVPFKKKNGALVVFGAGSLDEWREKMRDPKKKKLLIEELKKQVDESTGKASPAQ